MLDFRPSRAPSSFMRVGGIKDLALSFAGDAIEATTSMPPAEYRVPRPAS
jgi:hypothetical protein